MRKKVPRRLTLSVVGIEYRVTLTTRQMVLARMEDAGPIACRLEREPTNTHDRNAIKVIIAEKPYAKLHLGYLRRQIAQVLAKPLDRGVVVVKEAHLVELWPRDGEGEILVTLLMPVGKYLENGALKEI